MKFNLFRILAKRKFKYKIAGKKQENGNFKKFKSRRVIKKSKCYKISSLFKNTRKRKITFVPLAYI